MRSLQDPASALKALLNEVNGKARLLRTDTLALWPGTMMEFQNTKLGQIILYEKWHFDTDYQMFIQGIFNSIAISLPMRADSLLHSHEAMSSTFELNTKLGNVVVMSLRYGRVIIFINDGL